MINQSTFRITTWHSLLAAALLLAGCEGKGSLSEQVRPVGTKASSAIQINPNQPTCPGPVVSGSRDGMYFGDGSTVCVGTEIVLTVANPNPNYTYEWIVDHPANTYYSSCLTGTTLHITPLAPVPVAGYGQSEPYKVTCRVRDLVCQHTNFYFTSIAGRTSDPCYNE